MNRHARQLFYFGWGNLAPVFNPLAQAVAILTKYGGSLWVADPRYTFTGSDGTGAAGDNSDTGYVRDLCGNARPLTQATTGFKPKLRRLSDRWVWVFDGVDDALANNSTIDSTGSGTYVVACSYAGSKTTWQTAMSTGATGISGTRIACEDNTGRLCGVVRTGAGDGPVLYSPFPVRGSTGIYSLWRDATSGLTRLRSGGSVVSSATQLLASNPQAKIVVGALPNSSEFLQGSVFAAAYAPAAIPDAELLIIEKAMAQLAGVTI